MRSDDRLVTIGSSRPSAHLTDDQLMEIYVLAGENRHLGECRQCTARFEDLVHSLEQIREDALREADSVFTAERLHDQHSRIMRRLARHGHPAEVLAFPQRTASQPAVHRVLGPARRWVAGAAAAGLAAGMFLGFAMDRRTHYAMLERETPRSVSAATATWKVPVENARDDQFFTEIEDALMGSRAAELRAIDTMTTPVEIREASYPR